jgi:peptidoglycan hydrolase-like protein with peptidoglycan-binding domain
VPKLLDMGAGLYAHLQRPGVRAALAFLVVATAIATNALFFQPRHHPAPLLATRGVAEPEPAKGDPLVRSVQVALSRAGLYAGAVDGIVGPQTKAAIESFERSAGREPTGEASVDLLAAILSAEAPARTGSTTQLATSTDDSITEVAQDEPVPGDPLVASVQNALALSAYGPLTADGVVGPDTRAAIMRFQRDHSLPVTGEISDGLIVELRATGAMRDGG